MYTYIYIYILYIDMYLYVVRQTFIYQGAWLHVATATQTLNLGTHKHTVDGRNLAPVGRWFIHVYPIVTVFHSYH